MHVVSHIFTGEMALVYIVAAYLLGSIPVGVVLAKLKGQDPRKAGSGNIGATNVMRTVGKGLGILTLAGDILKGFLPTWLAIHYDQSAIVVAACGLAAFAGHLWPIYLGFKGGKGVATALGLFLALKPAVIPLLIVVFTLLLLKWRYVSLGSLVGTALMPLLLLIFGSPVEYVIVSLIVGLLIYYKHRDNIKRLMSGKEHKFRGTAV
jgi:acyl phosphate:glycerol-3-phosphate acyltransferase